MPGEFSIFNFLTTLSLLYLQLLRILQEVLELLPDYLREYIAERREAERLDEYIRLAEENNRLALQAERALWFTQEQVSELEEKLNKVEEESVATTTTSSMER